MIRKALEYLMEEKSNIKTVLKENTLYSDRQLYEVKNKIPMADAIHIHSLTGLIDYIKSDTDGMSDKMIIEVSSPTEVMLYSDLNDNRQREYIVSVNANLPEFYFDHFYDQESFCINLQSKFMSNEDRELLLKFAGTVEAGTIAQYGDDGVTQKATIKTGLASKGDALIPSPVKLQPYRTFLEVEQPVSDFIFRMKEGGGGVNCAIFEADGGAWKIEAMQNIKAYLQEELKDKPQFTVIA